MTTTAYPIYERPAHFKKPPQMVDWICEAAKKIMEKGCKVFEGRRKDRRHAIMNTLQVLANAMSIEKQYTADITVRKLAAWSNIGLRRTHRVVADLVKEGYISLATIENNSYHKIVGIQLNSTLLLRLGIKQKYIQQTQSFKLKSLEKQGKGAYSRAGRDYSPQPNKITQEAIKEVEEGKGKRYQSVEAVMDIVKEEPIQDKPVERSIQPRSFMDKPDEELSGPERIRKKMELAVQAATQQNKVPTTMAEAKAFISRMARKSGNRQNSKPQKYFGS